LISFILFYIPALHHYSTTMYLTRSEYDRGVNTFSPEGRLFQVRPYMERASGLTGISYSVDTRTGPLLVLPLLCVAVTFPLTL
jgi:hypothetical protein